MADIRSFRGFRYDLGKVGDLSNVIAPPYDVIDAKLQQHLYDLSPENAIRVELTKDEPGDTESNNRYSRAAQTINGWIQSGAIMQDSLRNFYILEQEFTVEGRTYKRRGFFARVRLEKFGEGKIYPHEQTFSGPKEDRLKLYRATGMNLSPVFGLYPDPDNEVFSLLDVHTIRHLPLQATDHLGVVSRMWQVMDEKTITGVQGLMSNKPVFIADGHHRYETGLKYLEEQIASNSVANDESAANFVLMMLVSMSDPGLIIQPTHRLVSGLPAITSEELIAALSPAFDIKPIHGEDATPQTLWESIEIDGSQDLLGLHTTADNVWHTAKLTKPEFMKELAPNQTEEWQGLGVSILHVLILNKLLAEKYPGERKIRYVHQVSEVVDAIAAKEPQLSVLVQAATMDHVESIAGNLEKMPQKSTYFYPKLPTGLLFNSLKVN
jgi:uncharacterized protein (DUF1015 family)